MVSICFSESVISTDKSERVANFRFGYVLRNFNILKKIW